MVIHVSVYPYHLLVVVDAVRCCPGTSCHGQVTDHQNILAVFIKEADAAKPNEVSFFENVNTYLPDLLLLSDYSIPKLVSFS